MSTLSRIQSKIQPQLNQLNQLIANTLQSSNELMNGIIDNYLATKGKQIRPIMVILSGRLLGDINTPSLISAAASVELLHNASLIHDDVVDETDMRRNQPTINGLWDNHIAVLVGDFFVSSSLQRALDTADLRIISAVADLGKLLSLGEIDQIYNARFHHIDRDAYFGIIDRKTASLFVACARMGAYAVGATDEQIAPLLDFARDLGLCFQIKDDIFDYLPGDKIGKPTGNDLREGKITLPLIYALDNSTDADNATMIELSRKETLTSDEIDMLIAYARRQGGIEYAAEQMRLMRDRAVGRLTAAYGTPESNPAVADLIDIFDYTIARDF